MKDYFSSHSDQYALYRPGYPEALFSCLNTLVKHRENAWDCATGNGQVACKLAASFQNVYATDISETQLREAAQLPNIHYSLQAAEAPGFPDNFFDLVIVAQAIHWFDFEKFYAALRRVTRPEALLLVIGYGKIQVNPALDRIIDRLYYDIAGAYWDVARKYIDEGYRTIPFPFREIPLAPPENTFCWTFPQLTGYLRTWSAVTHYRKDKGLDPVSLIEEELRLCWGSETQKEIRFPLLLRAGQIHAAM